MRKIFPFLFLVFGQTKNDQNKESIKDFKRPLGTFFLFLPKRYGHRSLSLSKIDFQLYQFCLLNSAVVILSFRAQNHLFSYPQFPCLVEHTNCQVYMTLLVWISLKDESFPIRDYFFVFSVSFLCNCFSSIWFVFFQPDFSLM